MNCLRKKISESKTATFQMRINPDVKKQAEEVFAAYGLTLTEAVNIFIHQSLREGGPSLCALAGKPGISAGTGCPF